MRSLKYLLIFFIVIALSGCDMLLEELEQEFDEEYTEDVDPISEQDAIDYYGGTYAFMQEDGYTLYFPWDDSNILVCIDSNLPEDYITASIMAVEEFDALDFITLSYEMSDDPDTEVIEGCSFTIDEDGYEVSDYNIVYSYYVEENDNLAYNEYEAMDGIIYFSLITFNLYNLDGEDFALLEHVALHELGHTFGLDDLYLEELGEHSIMYNNDEYSSPDLLPYDLYNLEWMYYTNDEDPEE